MNDITSTSEEIRKDPMRYVHELTSKPSVTLEALLNVRKSVQICADETNTQLKKNVYTNYQLFIDTSKEISYLKSEMSQLNRHLNEEYKLLDQMLNISIGGSRAGLTASEKKEALDKAKEERERKLLQQSQSNLNGPLPTKEFKSLIDNIEGGVGILETRLNCLVYYEGEVIELDDDYHELNSLYLVLLNDALIINTIIDKNRIQAKKIGGGHRKYKFHSIIDLETIAVVNVKDRRYAKFEMAFKILMTSTTKVFLTSSPAKKKAWIDSFDIAKKYRRTHRLQRRDTMCFGSPQSANSLSSSNSNFDMIQSTNGSSASAKQSTFAPVTLNPFEEPEMEESNESDPELPFWLIELPDDLDVYIAQRNFEEAVKLVSRAHEHFFLYPKWCDNQMQVDLKLKIDNKISELVDALTAELNIAPDRSLQTGPRASRRAVSLLLLLGKSSLAIRLFLEQRTKLMNYYFKQQKSSESQTLAFMKRMTNLFFSQIVETSKEFLRAFEIDQSELMPDADAFDSLGDSVNQRPPWHRQASDDSGSVQLNRKIASSLSNSYSHTALACLNAWCYRQLQFYLNHFSKHVFINQVNTLVAAECVSLAIHHCVKLRQTIGIDFMFVLSREFQDKISHLISEMRDKFLEAIKLRAAEDKQQVFTFDSRNRLNKFANELLQYDIDVEDFVREDKSNGKSGFTVNLTNNTVTFVKSYINTMKDLLKLSCHPTMVKQINEALIVAFKAQMKHLVMCLKTNKDPELIRQNIVFILEKFIPATIRRYCDILHVRTFNELQVLSIDYGYLKDSTGSTYSGGSTPDKGSPFGSPVPIPRTRKSQVHIGKNSTTATSTGDSPSVKNYSMATYL